MTQYDILYIWDINYTSYRMKIEVFCLLGIELGYIEL